jgi:hypothetical protein
MNPNCTREIESGRTRVFDGSIRYSVVFSEPPSDAP